MPNWREKSYERRSIEVDRSDAADARRLRWMLNGNGYFLEENMLCGHPTDEGGQDLARDLIDQAMADSN